MQRLWFWVFLALTVTCALYICAFHLIDGDFWWHVKAGEILWKTKRLITVEPFSATLDGRPYTALHEWLAQIVFYLTYAASGVTGAIVLRGLLVAGAAAALLHIDRRAFVWQSLLVVIAFYAFRASFMVRPQLFTLLLLCTSLLLTLRYACRHWAYFAAVLCIQILWVNLHGASAIFGVLCVAGLCLQALADWYGARENEAEDALRSVRFFALLLAACAAALLLSPKGVYTLADMYAHRFDRTIPLVREWMPMGWGDYLLKVVPFGFLAAVSVLLRRRFWVLCATVLAVLFLMSFESFRHCILFVSACLAVTFFQWKGTRKETALTLSLGLTAFALLVAGMYRQDLSLRREGVFGFGVRISVEKAFDFVEREGITGKMFNTYNQGSYLLFRGYPDRQVFVDGRNIDYGYPFLQKLMDAGTNPVRWKELEAEHRFDYAVVEYKAVADYGSLLPYINSMESDSSWVLVYVDDDAAVYVRDLPRYATLIEKHAYRIVRPGALEFTDALAALPEDRWPQAEMELRRAAAEDPASMKARLQLGDRYFATGRLKEADALALAAAQAQPLRPEPYELLGRIAAANQDWLQAGEYLERAVRLSAGEGPGINYDYLAMIFSKSGQQDKADAYHLKAVRAGQSSPVMDE